MIEKEIKGEKYRVGRIDAMKQFHVARRLAPVLAETGPVLLAAIKASRGEELPADPMHLFEPIAKAIGALSDADSEAIIRLCLSNVQRASGSGWAPVQTSTGKLMFEDIDFPVLMQLVSASIQENLANFLPASPSPSAKAPAV